MRRPLLVTVSGMVGSGKSTAVRHILRVLEEQGTQAVHWRFRQLPCFTLRPARASAATRATSVPHAERGRGYRRRRLTAWIAIGHVLRIVAFRIFRSWPRPLECIVIDRYFYDSLVHFDLAATAERRYQALLAKLMPTPDLAILLVASSETIAARRPSYSAEYLYGVADAYRRLHSGFPKLIEISSEPDDSMQQRIETILRDRVARRGPGVVDCAAGDGSRSWS